VIIPTYNRAHLVGEAIHSVLCQTFTDFEVIVVDDGSTDNTSEVVHSFKDPRLKYIRQPNRGAAVARNTAIQASRGEFVACLDSDDLFLPEKLTLQMAKVAEQPEVGLVYGLALSTTGRRATKKSSYALPPQLTLRRLLLGPAFTWSTVLIRRDWLDQVGGFDENFYLGQDWELTLRLALAGCPMACVAQPVSTAREQLESNTRKLPQNEAGMMAILDKTFSDPRMPAELLTMRTLCYATQLIRIAASAYVNSQPELGQNYLQRALMAEPGLIEEHADELVNLLVYRIRGLSLDDPKETLQQMTQFLPGDKIFSSKLRRRLWGRFYEVAAFQSYQLDESAQCIDYVIRAISKTPSSLRNRGLISIFVRSLVGNQISNQFKRLLSIQEKS
jgi:glycosyltransferase involved in cell wall biosynthesis